jgi:hypothetical protein
MGEVLQVRLRLISSRRCIIGVGHPFDTVVLKEISATITQEVETEVDSVRTLQ